MTLLSDHRLSDGSKMAQFSSSGADRRVSGGLGEIITGSAAAARHAAALLDQLDSAPFSCRHLSWTVEEHGDALPAARQAAGARLEGAPPPALARDVERVALAVAESVDDAPGQAAGLAQPADQRLRLTPVLLQVLLLCHEPRAPRRL